MMQSNKSFNFIHIFCVVFSVLLFSTIALSAETPNIKAGTWRVAIQMIVPNATGPSTGPMQYDRCLNADNVVNLSAMPAGAPCKLLESKLQRDSLSWKLSCSQGGYTSVATGRLKFSDTTLTGEVITLAEGMQKVKITTKIEGRYIGECIAPQKSEPIRQENGLKPYKE